jgi:asparagine synthase (glutamine-hydrolysing)
MCGIAGSIGPASPAIAAAVRAISDCERHRGPDGDGFWQSDRATLAHRRLAIIDLSSDGDQPMSDPETGNVIAFNGEIYGFRVLRDELIAMGCRFRTQSDTEVILRAYAKWGRECLGRLRGMFALALWDARAQTVLLARDRVGIKPLYWTTVSDGGNPVILFASEVRALLATGMCERKIDPVGLSSFLWNGFTFGPSTFVRGINLLPPGASALVSTREPRIKPEPYWLIPSASAHPTSDTSTTAAALKEAVGQHLIADVPLGVFLSGGVDSSAIAALAVRCAPSKVRTFNVAFDEADLDESPYARRVAGQLGTDHHELRLSQSLFKDQLPAALESLDQPTFDAINTYFVSRIVREAGIKVALAGTGGDELFGGYKSFTELPRLQRAASACSVAPRSLIRAAAHAAARLKTGPAGDFPPQTRWGKLADALTAGGRMLDIYQTAYALFTRDFLDELSGHDANGWTRSGVPTPRASELESLINGSASLSAISALEVSCFLSERLLRDTDTTSMAVALEVRVPLLDHVLIESLAALDDRTRFSPVGRKQLLRDLALSDLDPAIFDRPKSGFVLPLEVWCRKGLTDEISETFADRGLCEAVGVDADAIGRLWKAFRAGAPGLYWSRIWALFVLLWWSRRYQVSR